MDPLKVRIGREVASYIRMKTQTTVLTLIPITQVEVPVARMQNMYANQVSIQSYSNYWTLNSYFHIQENLANDIIHN